MNLLSFLPFGFLTLKKMQMQMQEISITETTVGITMIITVRALLLFPAKTQISSHQISRMLNFGIALSSGERACIMEFCHTNSIELSLFPN